MRKGPAKPAGLGHTALASRLGPASYVALAKLLNLSEVNMCLTQEVGVAKPKAHTHERV